MDGNTLVCGCLIKATKHHYAYSNEEIFFKKIIKLLN